MRHCLPLCLVLAMVAPPAKAGEATGPGTHASVTLERHYTTNALDEPLAIDDWYTALRGSLRHTVVLDRGKANVSASLEATRHDRVDIEDDRGFFLSAEASHRFGNRVEMRGSLSWHRYSEGDDLPIAGTIIGIRTLTDTVSAGLEAGIDLGGGTVLTLAGSDTLELPQEAHFEDDVLSPRQLEPRRNRVNVATDLTHRAGPLAYGVKTEAEWADIARLGDPQVNLSYALLTLRGEATLKAGHGALVSAALGAQWLRGESGLYEELRPAFAVKYQQALRGGLQLRSSLTARYETIDTDDPLASWIRRAELEMTAPVTRRIELGGGVFGETRENFLLENRQRRYGAYARLTYRATDAVSLFFQAGYRRDHVTIVDATKNTVDAYVGLEKDI